MTLKKKSNLFAKSVVLCSIALANCGASNAQLHAPFLGQNTWIGLAIEHTQQNLHYASKFSAEEHLLQNKSVFFNTDPIIQEDRALFLSINSGLKIQNAQAETDAIHFLNTTVNPVFKERTAYSLAQYYFNKAKWKEAIAYYETANISNLDNQEIVSSKFELAYCYFNDLQFNKAETLFATLKDIDGNYNAAVNYYYGLIAYNKSNFKEALKSFERIENLSKYQKVVPYYIAEILYFDGARAKSLQKVKQILANKEKTYYDNELHLLAAQCLFEEEKYKESIPYFESYYNNVDKIRKQDVYKMGYAYYRNEQWQKAIVPFQQLSSVQDALGQTAMYFLGDCYLKINDKKGAKNAFNLCSEVPFNKSIVEASLYLSGKLAFELGYSKEGSSQLRKLMNEFPNSVYKEEVVSILSEQLLQSNNYSDAYQMLSGIASPSRLLMQKCTYGYALQKLQQNNWSDGEKLLNESLHNNENPELEAASYFWKSEIDYHNKNYTSALSNGKEFIAKNKIEVTSIYPDATKQNALMTMAYSALNLQDYAQARSLFADAQNKQLNPNFSSKLSADAALREADAAFLQKDYVKASELYNKTIAINNSDADYARFQKSTLLGLQGKSAEQVEILQDIIAQKNPESKYKYEAHYALGDLHLDANKFEDAINHFQKINDKTAKHLAAKALMKIGFAYQEAENTDNAIEAYKKVVLNYPNSEQKSAALEALKSLYVSNNQPKAYVQLLKDNNINTTENASLDSLFYDAAEIQFSSNKYTQSKEAFKSYLTQYPQGIFITKAHFYKAECHEQLKEIDSAIIGYNFVLNQPWNDFTELAAKKAATLSFVQNDYLAAEHYYGVLRNNAISKDNLKTAYRGLMLSSKNLVQYERSNNYADTLLSIPDLDQQSKDEAILTKGIADLNTKKTSNASVLLSQVSSSKNIEIAAEAIYYQAKISLYQNKISEAEIVCNKAIQQTAGSAYWNTKCYLLMADIFIQQKDYFNAKATLQSIIKNVKNEALKKEAISKLEEVKILEKVKSKLSEG